MLKGRTFSNLASSYFSCGRKRSDCSANGTETTGNKAKLNQFGGLKYASREPYVFPRKRSNYYNYFCQFALGYFLLQEYVGALLGSLLPVLLHRAEIQGMVINLEFVKHSRKINDFKTAHLFKSHCMVFLAENEIALNTLLGSQRFSGGSRNVLTP